MANKAVELRQPVAVRWSRIPFELRLVVWWCLWLLILLFLFSGILIAIGPIQIKTAGAVGGAGAAFAGGLD